MKRYGWPELIGVVIVLVALGWALTVMAPAFRIVF